MKKYKLAFVSGNFTIIHPGHIRILKYAKDLANKLVVGVNADEFLTTQKIVTERERFDYIKSLSFVDNVFLIKKSIASYIRDLKPDIIVKGDEWSKKSNPEEKELVKYGGKLIFSSGDNYFKSKNFFYFEKNFNSFIKPMQFINRNKIDLNVVRDNLKHLKNLKVAVFGDLILDIYKTCLPVGLSQEDMNIVYNQTSQNSYLGGAGIVAAHSRSFSKNVDFYSIIGDDVEGKKIIKMLDVYNVNSNNILIDKTRPTTSKTRFIHNKKSLFRLSEYHTQKLDITLEKRFHKTLENKNKYYDVIILSDFNYGFLSKKFLNFLIKKFKNTFIVADCQSSSQIGNLNKYSNIDMIIPTEHEARSSLHDNESGLAEISMKVSKLINCKYVLLKLGEDGVLINDFTNKRCKTEQIQALNNYPVNVSGAGDSMLVLSSLYYAYSKNINEAALIGSIAAALQISRVGNIPVTLKEVELVLDSWMH